MTLSIHQATIMLSLQDAMNRKVNPDWLTAGYPFLRAIVVEGAEGMEHHGWKWWKAQTADMPQLQMELIDIWHFMLSHFILNMVGSEGRIEVAASFICRQASMGMADNLIFDGSQRDIEAMDIITKLELMIGLAVARRTSIPLFKSLMDDCGMDWNVLYRQYVAKNILNMFRQDNGYKQGTYRKIWNGQEDNEHLVELMSAIDADVPNYAGQLYDGLRQRYAAQLASV